MLCLLWNRRDVVPETAASQSQGEVTSDAARSLCCMRCALLLFSCGTWRRPCIARARIGSRYLSDGQALHLHNLQGIGRRTWPRSQLVIEYHAPVVHLFAEVIIANTGYGVGQGDEFQVMRRDDANAMPACESMDVGTAANEALAIIGAAKNFVDQEAQGHGL